ncbi:MAG: trigger factor, partial [Planctomycetaceae bacterium]|nr:trigger factor [Planctomycetaceae bacterium]
MSTEDVQVAESGEAAEDKKKLNLVVDITTVGPCRKHVSVTVPEADVQMLREASLDEFTEQAFVPGFRQGNVPRSLLQKRFRSELADQVKQKVLLQSLEQMSDSDDIDPINQPEIDVDSLDVPDTGDFRYEFDVEVRPEFDLPDYTNFVIDRQPTVVTDDEFRRFRDRFVASYSTAEIVDRPAEAGDTVVCHLSFMHQGKEIREADAVHLKIRPKVRFQDALLEDFDKLMIGAKADESRTAEITISLQSPVVEMRGEAITVTISVQSVRQNVPPTMDRAFLSQFDCETEAELDEQLRKSVERQAEFQQRQTAREQVLEKIGESADWDLPESLVKHQTENALRREILEMTQAGFTREQIASRENEIRQTAIETTRQALKEHFVLDRIATTEELECLDSDITDELRYMSRQSGEPVRRLRARMGKNGMIENLQAQIRERKAVDFILQHATFR